MVVVVCCVVLVVSFVVVFVFVVVVMVVVVFVVVGVVVVVVVVVGRWRCCCGALLRGSFGLPLVSFGGPGHPWASLWGHLGSRVGSEGLLDRLGWFKGVFGTSLGVLGWLAGPRVAHLVVLRGDYSRFWLSWVRDPGLGSEGSLIHDPSWKKKERKGKGKGRSSDGWISTWFATRPVP